MSWFVGNHEWFAVTATRPSHSQVSHQPVFSFQFPASSASALEVSGWPTSFLPTHTRLCISIPPLASTPAPTFLDRSARSLPLPEPTPTPKLRQRLLYWPAPPLLLPPQESRQLQIRQSFPPTRRLTTLSNPYRWSRPSREASVSQVNCRGLGETSIHSYRPRPSRAAITTDDRRPTTTSLEPRR